MLQGAVVTCLGKAAARGLLFPLLYAFFLVPVGEELVPPLQTVTAAIAMALLAVSGPLAHLEGVFISTPRGYFEVAEACSGVQFLIAMIAFGALVANVCFRSWPRRIGFVAASIVVPVLANGIRAWATILIAHHTGIGFAAGFDHVLYGGVFFAVVMALLLAIGWRFFDRAAGGPWLDPSLFEMRTGRRSHLISLAAASLAIAAIPMVWSASVAAGSESAMSDLRLPEPSGWHRVADASGRAWQPSYAGADRIRHGRYRNAAGQEVDLVLVYFARQGEGRELVGFGQGPLDAAGKWAWIGDGPAPPGGRLDRIASFGTVREVATFYRVGSILTGSPAKVKFETMKTRLLGGPQRAVAVLVSGAAPAEGVSPRPAIDAFIADLGSIEALADGAAGSR
jgi:EpsI family protein